MPVWMGFTPYHGGGVPAERVKLILLFYNTLFDDRVKLISTGFYDGTGGLGHPGQSPETVDVASTFEADGV